MMDANAGSSAEIGKTLCGTHTNPCSRMQQCFRGRGYEYKEVLIVGEYTAISTVKIDISCSISGFKNTTITGTTHSYIFEAAGNSKININITNLQFHGIGILKVGTNAEVSIRNCTTVDVLGNVVWLLEHVEKISLHVFQCIFIHGAEYVVKMKKSDTSVAVYSLISVYIEGCNFIKSKGLLLESSSALGVVMQNNIFQSSVSPVVVLGGKNNLSNVKLINCSFQSITTRTSHFSNSTVHFTGVTNINIQYSQFMDSSANSQLFIEDALSIVIKSSMFGSNSVTQNDKGGTVVISKSLNTLLFGSVFANNEAMNGGSIVANSVKTLKINNCTFRDNNAKSYGGDVYLEKVYKTVFVSCLFINSSSGAR